MIRHGTPPYLECSSAGDRRFSAFYARFKSGPWKGKSIEELYQASKIFDSGGANVSGLSIKMAKGRKALNAASAAAFYRALWRQYIKENPELLPVLKSASGLSDKFGQVGHVCQATELWRIRNAPTK